MNHRDLTRESEPFSSIDWMLQSDQVDDGGLATALVEGFGESLFRLAMMLVGDPCQAERISNETLAWAVLNRRHYWHETSLKSWLFSRALRLCQQILLLRKFRLFFQRSISLASFASVPAGYRSQSILNSVKQRLSKKEAGLRRSLSAREIALSGFILGLVFWMGYLGGLWSPDIVQRQVVTVLHTQIVTRVVEQKVSTRIVVVEPTQTPFPTESIQWLIYRVKPGDTLSSIGVKVGISPEMLREYTGLTEGMEIVSGMTLRIPIPSSPSQMHVTPTPVPTHRHPLP